MFANKMAHTYNERLKRVSALATKLGSSSSTSSVKSEATPEETDSGSDQNDSIFNASLQPNKLNKKFEKMSISPDRLATKSNNLLKQQQASQGK